MKWIIAIAVSLLAYGGQGQQTVSVNTEGTAFYNLQFTGAFALGTNYNIPTAATNLAVSPALYHTVQILSTNGNSQYVIDASVDGTNWFVGATNALVANVVAEATLTKKENFLRIRLQGTNQTITLNYLGGR